MKITLIALALVTLAVPAHADTLILPSAAFLSAQAADLVTTSAAINRGAVEANPIMGQGMGRQVALKAAVSVGVLLVARQMARTGHPRAAKIMLWAATAGIGAVAVHNSRVK